MKEFIKGWLGLGPSKYDKDIFVAEDIIKLVEIIQEIEEDVGALEERIKLEEFKTKTLARKIDILEAMTVAAD